MNLKKCLFIKFTNLHRAVSAAFQDALHKKYLIGLEPEQPRLRLAAAQCGKARPFRKRSLTSFSEAEPQEKFINKN